MKLRAITVRIPHEADADIEALCAATARRAGFPVREGDVFRAAFLRGVKVLLLEANEDQSLTPRLLDFSAKVREITTKTGSPDPQEQALLGHRVRLLYRDIITRLPLDDPRRRTVDQLWALVEKDPEGPPLLPLQTARPWAPEVGAPPTVVQETAEEVHPDPKAVLYVSGVYDPEGLSDLYCKFIAAADRYHTTGGFPQDVRSSAVHMFHELYGRCPRTDPRWVTIVETFELLNPSSQERPRGAKPTE